MQQRALVAWYYTVVKTLRPECSYRRMTMAVVVPSPKPLELPKSGLHTMHASFGKGNSSATVWTPAATVEML